MPLIVTLAIFAIIAVGIFIMGGPWMQRLVIANLWGLAFVAAATLAAALFNTVSSGWVWSSWALPWTLGSSCLALMDLGYRYLRIRSERGRPVDQADASAAGLKNHWLTPTRGASLIVFPAWIVAALAAVAFAVLSVRDLMWEA